MKKAIIIAIIIILISIAGFMIFHFLSEKEETAYVLFTDRPGDEVGKDYIDGEVFFVKPSELP